MAEETMSYNGYDLERGADGWVVARYQGSEAEVVVPDNVEGLPVVLIAKNAFEDNRAIESVEVPATVTFVGNYAFSSCTSLKRVIVRGPLERLNFGTFWNCTSLVDVQLPETITIIGDGSFKDCTALTSIAIPPSVTEIGDRAFSGCTALRSITVPDGVKTIMRSAFRECASLSSVTVNSSLTYVGPRAFQGCPLLKSVTILGDRIGSTVEAFFNNHSMSYLVADYAIERHLMPFEDAKKLLKSEIEEERVFAARVAASYPDRLDEVPLKQGMAKLLASGGCTEELKVVADKTGFLPKMNLQACIELATANGHTETAAYLLDLLASMNTASASSDNLRL